MKEWLRECQAFLESVRGKGPRRPAERLEDADGRRFTVDLDTDFDLALAPGLPDSAVVNDEGYAVKVSAAQS